MPLPGTELLWQEWVAYVSQFQELLVFSGVLETNFHEFIFTLTHSLFQFLPPQAFVLDTQANSVFSNFERNHEYSSLCHRSVGSIKETGFRWHSLLIQLNTIVTSKKTHWHGTILPPPFTQGSVLLQVFVSNSDINPYCSLWHLPETLGCHTYIVIPMSEILLTFLELYSLDNKHLYLARYQVLQIKSRPTAA